MAMSLSVTLHPPNPRRSTTPPLAATANDGDLPLDLLYEILLRLPTEPICRFRAVCRSWRSLLCHPDFIAAAHNPGPFLAIGVKDLSSSNEVQLLDMKSGDAVKHVKIDADDAFVQSYSSEERALSDACVICVLDKSGRLRLLDLASGVFSLFPDHVPPLGYSYRSCFVGRAACTGEIKVLAMSPAYKHHEQHVCKIIILGNAAGWRDTGSPPLKVMMWCAGDFAVVNGVVYFLSDYNKYEELNKHKIMAFDLNSEAWRPVSTSLPGPTKHLCLADMDGHLVASHSDGVLSTEIELWFLVDLERSHWSKRYIITMPCHQNILPPMCYEYIVQPLAMLDDGRIVLWIRVAGLENGAETDVLWIYNPRTNTFKEGTRVPYCSRVSVFTWNLLHSRRRGAIDMAAKCLVISGRHHQRGGPSSTNKGHELFRASTKEDTCSN